MGIDFEDLDSTESRHRFNSFVSAWNEGSLRDAIYNPQKADLHAFQRTKHSWSVKLSGDEKLALDSLRDKVTDANTQGGVANRLPQKRNHADIVGPHGASGPVRGPPKVARTGTANIKRAEILRKKLQADALEDARMEAFKKAMGLA